MTEDYAKLAVISSGTCWCPKELRFHREESSVIEAVFSGIREKEGRLLTFRGYDGGHPRDAVELFLGFDDFVVTDLAKKDPQREVGRFEMLIFRSDECFKLAFDRYEIEEK